jgi:hypothetical protein
MPKAKLKSQKKNKKRHRTPHCRTYRRKSPHTKAQRGGTSAVQPFCTMKKKDRSSIKEKENKIKENNIV